MTGVIRTAVLLALPHGGQRRARANALAGLRDVRESVSLQAEAARAFERCERPEPERRAVSR